jgi:hypothetical protein
VLNDCASEVGEQAVFPDKDSRKRFFESCHSPLKEEASQKQKAQQKS